MARYTQHQRDVAYRVYVADCLRQMTENTAKMGGGKYITARLYDVIYGEAQKNLDAKEIIADVTTRAGIEVI